ncbi:ATP-binding protein [Spongiibacter sp. UBA1325]|uniref:ATP-binding protein n=1 Tax=Spongiibacter sp. UBA1325 TaxID=1947543 RepID=UPI00257F34A5|nr:ATP-binding protein [Spongiibacter sp. UBA1325]|tara:strand:+ start:9575 stop:11128 length:1554 start_codon:yes stop_codon:yes gene_type:complete
MLRDLPIQRKILVSIVGTVTIVLVMIETVFVLYNWISVRETVQKNLLAVAEVFSLNTTAAMSFSDSQAAEEILSSLRGMPEIHRACLYQGETKQAQLFASYVRGSDAKDCPLSLLDVKASKLQVLTVNRDVWLGSERLGRLVIERQLSDLWASTRLDIMLLLLMLLLSVGIAFVISNTLQKLIAGPILALLDTTRKVSLSGDYSLRADKHGDDEVGELIDGFNVMLSHIATRDTDLASAKEELTLRIHQADAANTELRKAVEDLNRTQKQLVATEKMASLGGLVAGVAHEVNTPVGVSVTAASTLRAESIEAEQAYNEGKLTGSGLKHYFEHCMQSTEIILNNLRRAADLVHSFKQVAVDQTSFERRKFNLKSYFDETLLSLRPNLKNTQIAVEIDCEASLEANSVPGAISQIFTNLLMNSLMHAFPGGEAGRIRVVVTECDGDIEICYSDDGCGMDEEAREKIFEPFFTTKRGAGGSGLGMHIVFNLVSQQLKGQVEVLSALGEGTEVRIRFPSGL